ncbi:hypothetical protein LJC22_01795 [Desulfosarcina sp. OttesenSCG-928-G10]|nr:hypothetical protein [Desulfosarcina sp. OttesenSCG-928-G10]
MKKLYLAQIDRQLFAVDRKDVIGVGVYNADASGPARKSGRQYLLLPNGKRAMMCDLRTLMTGHDAEAPVRQHYLIVNQTDLVLGLAMDGKGKTITMDVAAARPLPPAFTGQSRILVPGVLTGGRDLIFLLDLQAVLDEMRVRGVLESSGSDPGTKGEA